MPIRTPASEETTRSAHLRPGRLGLVAAVAVAACTPTGADPSPSPGPSPDPPLAERLEAGIEDYFDGVPFLENNVRAVVVTVDGERVLELYRGATPEETRNVMSVTKSVVSTLVGIAVDDGLLRLDAPLAELLPEYAPTMTPDVATTTLHDLLTMTGPFPSTWLPGGGTEAASHDWVANWLSAGTRPRTGRFAYSDPSADLVAAVLARATEATGRSLLEYAREKLFEPLGIDTTPVLEPVAVPENLEAYEAAGFAWPTDPQRRHLGSALMKLRPDDMARIGMLYLADGEWDGRQVVSAEWVERATTSHVRAGSSGAANGYGYLWWVGSTIDDHDAFLAWGFAGQLIHVVPELGLVTVVSTEVELDESPAVHPDTLTHNLVNNLVLPVALELQGAGE